MISFNKKCSTKKRSTKKRSTKISIEHAKRMKKIYKYAKNVVFKKSKSKNFKQKRSEGIETGKFLGNYPLFMKWSYDDNNSYNFKVYIPKSYKTSYLAPSYIKDKKIIAECQIYFLSENELYVNDLYVYTVNNKTASINEKKELKGLGKIMLCKALKFIVELKNINTDNLNISITAHGDECPEKIMNDIKDWSDIQINEYLNKYKDSDKNLDSLCIDIASKTLVEYYISLGFKIYRYNHPGSVNLKNKYYKIIEKCKL